MNSFTEIQRKGIETVMNYALTEIQLRCGSGDSEGASQLAYCCHNLPGWHRDEGDYFTYNYFRRWFHLFHEQHGRALYNYLAMIDAIEQDQKIDIDIATKDLGKLESIKDQFITWEGKPLG